MKRRDVSTIIVVFVLASSATACSFIFDMGRYDDGPEGSASRPDESGSSSSGGGRSEGGTITGEPDSSSGSSGTDASSSSSSGDAAIAKCNDEIEPNDLEDDASLMMLGENCGTLSTTGDVDFFVFTVNKQTKIVGTAIPPGVKAHITNLPPGGTDLQWQGGGGPTTLFPGTYQVEVTYGAGPTPRAYKITLTE